MSSHLVRFGLAAIMCAGTACLVLAQQSPPQGATAQCKDGTYSTAAKKSEACKGHQGVKDWYNTVGGAVDPDIKSSRQNSRKVEKQTANSDEVVNPRSDTSMSNARASAINKKSGNATVATPDDNGKTIPGPAANGTAGADAAAGTSPSTAASGGAGANGSAAGNSARTRNSAKGSSSTSVVGRKPAPGGGPDRVWLNSGSNVYHCYGSALYGKTKNGKYVSEQEAVSAGAKPDHGKSCSSQ